MPSTEELLLKLGEGVERQNKSLAKLGEDVDNLKRTEGRIKELEDAHDKLTRQFGGGVRDADDEPVDTSYRSRRGGGRFPNRRAAADFCYFVGAALYRDSNCMEVCEKRGIRVDYERGSGERVDILKTRDMKVGNDPDGGYAVAPAPLQVIWEIADQYGMYADALVVPMTSAEQTILLPEDGVTFYFMDELQEAIKSGLTYSRAVLKALKVGAYAIWSGEFNEDVAAYTGEMLADLFGKALARKIDQCLFSGDGTAAYGGIVGILNNSAVPAVSLPATKTNPLDATLDDFLALKYSVPARVRKLADECAFYLHPDLLYVLEGLKDGMGRPIMSDPHNETERRLWGHPVREAMGYPDLGEIQAGTPWCTFGSLRRSVAVGIRRQLRIRRASELFALMDAEAMIAFARFAVTTFKPTNVANLATAEE